MKESLHASRHCQHRCRGDDLLEKTSTLRQSGDCAIGHLHVKEEASRFCRSKPIFNKTLTAKDGALDWRRLVCSVSNTGRDAAALPRGALQERGGTTRAPVLPNFWAARAPNSTPRRWNHRKQWDERPTRNGIDVPKWKRYFNDLNRQGRPSHCLQQARLKSKKTFICLWNGSGAAISVFSRSVPNRQDPWVAQATNCADHPGKRFRPEVVRRVRNPRCAKCEPLADRRAHATGPTAAVR